MLSPPENQGLQIERLVRYPLVIALPANHRLATRAQLSPRDLVGESYVTLAADVVPMYGEIVTEYWEQAGVAMKERLKVDQPHAVIDLVTAGAGFALVPSSVQEYEKKRIVCRPLDPAPPELELSLAWVRGVESPAINALLEVARQVVGPSRFYVSSESGADSHSGWSGLSGLATLSRPGATRHGRTIGAHHPGARSSLVRTSSTAATRRQAVDWDVSGKGRQGHADVVNGNDRC